MHVVIGAELRKLLLGSRIEEGVLNLSRRQRNTGIDDSLKKPPKPVVLNDSFPSDRHHGWKFIRFGPDGLLDVPVAAGSKRRISDSEVVIDARVASDR